MRSLFDAPKVHLGGVLFTLLVASAIVLRWESLLSFALSHGTLVAVTLVFVFFVPVLLFEELRPTTSGAGFVIALLAIATLVGLLLAVPLATEITPREADGVTPNTSVEVESAVLEEPISEYQAAVTVQCTPENEYLYAYRTAYLCEYNVSHVPDWYLLVDADLLRVQWRTRSGEVIAETTAINYTELDTNGSFDIVAPRPGQYQLEFEKNEGAIRHAIESEFEYGVNVTQTVEYDENETQQVYTENEIVSMKYQRVGLLLSMFVFLSVWIGGLSLMNSLRRTTEDGSDDGFEQHTLSDYRNDE